MIVIGRVLQVRRFSGKDGNPDVVAFDVEGFPCIWAGDGVPPQPGKVMRVEGVATPAFRGGMQLTVFSAALAVTDSK